MEQIIKNFVEELQKPSSYQDFRNPNRVSGLPAFKELFFEAKENKEKIPQIMVDVSSSLFEMDLFFGCEAGYFCGFLMQEIEQARKECWEILIDFFQKVLKEYKGFLEEVADQLGEDLEELEAEQLKEADIREIFEQHPDYVRAFRGCSAITLAVMAAITLDSDARLYLRKKEILEEIHFLKKFVSELFYVGEVHRACPTLSVVLLAPSRKKGLLAEINDIANNFHLITLLESELYRSGLADSFGLKDYSFEQEIYDYATGAVHPTKEGTTKVHNQYYTYQYLKPLKSKEGKNVGNITSSLIWGEAPPESIPSYEGKIVVVMDREGMFSSRFFDVTFLIKWDDNLKPYFKIIKELSQEEVEYYIKQINCD